MITVTLRKSKAGPIVTSWQTEVSSFSYSLASSDDSPYQTRVPTGAASIDLVLSALTSQQKAALVQGAHIEVFEADSDLVPKGLVIRLVLQTATAIESKGIMQLTCSHDSNVALRPTYGTMRVTDYVRNAYGKDVDFDYSRIGQVTISIDSLNDYAMGLAWATELPSSVSLGPVLPEYTSNDPNKGIVVYDPDAAPTAVIRGQDIYSLDIEASQNPVTTVATRLPGEYSFIAQVPFYETRFTSAKIWEDWTMYQLDSGVAAISHFTPQGVDIHWSDGVVTNMAAASPHEPEASAFAIVDEFILKSANDNYDAVEMIDRNTGQVVAKTSLPFSVRDFLPPFHSSGYAAKMKPVTTVRLPLPNTIPSAEQSDKEFYVVAFGIPPRKYDQSNQWWVCLLGFEVVHAKATDIWSMSPILVSGQDTTYLRGSVPSLEFPVLGGASFTNVKVDGNWLPAAQFAFFYESLDGDGKGQMIKAVFARDISDVYKYLDHEAFDGTAVVPFAATARHLLYHDFVDYDGPDGRKSIFVASGKSSPTSWYVGAQVSIESGGTMVRNSVTVTTGSGDDEPVVGSFQGSLPGTYATDEYITQSTDFNLLRWILAEKYGFTLTTPPAVTRTATFAVKEFVASNMGDDAIVVHRISDWYHQALFLGVQNAKSVGSDTGYADLVALSVLPPDCSPFQTRALASKTVKQPIAKGPENILDLPFRVGSINPASITRRDEGRLQLSFAYFTVGNVTYPVSNLNYPPIGSMMKVALDAAGTRFVDAYVTRVKVTYKGMFLVDVSAVVTDREADAPTKTLIYRVSSLPNGLWNDCKVFVWATGGSAASGAWLPVSKIDPSTLIFTVSNTPIEEFRVIRCHPDTVTPDWNAASDVAGRIYSVSDQVEVSSTEFEYLLGQMHEYNP